VDIHPPLRQREALLRFGKALGCRDNALRRDENGDWRIGGSKGHIYAVPGTLDERKVEGFQMFVTGCQTSRQWTAVKAAMKGFASLTNDGGDEGALFMGRLPTMGEAETIRRYCGVAKKRELGEEELARLRAFALETRFKPKLPASNDVDGSRSLWARKRLQRVDARVSCGLIEHRMLSPASGGSAKGCGHSPVNFFTKLTLQLVGSTYTLYRCHRRFVGPHGRRHPVPQTSTA
jgi:hypothetical protein